MYKVVVQFYYFKYFKSSLPNFNMYINLPDRNWTSKLLIVVSAVTSNFCTLWFRKSTPFCDPIHVVVIATVSTVIHNNPFVSECLHCKIIINVVVIATVMHNNPSVSEWFHCKVIINVVVIATVSTVIQNNPSVTGWLHCKITINVVVIAIVSTVIHSNPSVPLKENG
jgi:hypothetical protein